MGCSCTKSDVVVKSGKVKGGNPITRREVELPEDNKFRKEENKIKDKKLALERNKSPLRSSDIFVNGNNRNVNINTELVNNQRQVLESNNILRDSQSNRDLVINILPYLNSNCDPDFNFPEIGMDF